MSQNIDTRPEAPAAERLQADAEQRVDGQRLIEATRAALAADEKLLTVEEKSEIQTAMLELENLLSGKDHRKIKKAVEALNHATEEFAARRMDEGIKRALAGRKIGSL